ncbi:DUF6338 family protein [Goodfellowiella coeruleoviolacea]|uniref:Uncharacterized protein n=1 Tax=Goodfellowiella coeruleoviolacea TaxID=334858 RepID=A0AAE3GFI2_9PSEU|nr:DUF6338 family protein [Goodfellowiella coeruleoviolacea]MCP2167297.1 hypothetical protein [Goodfellowiella coeruleoviolacea]
MPSTLLGLAIFVICLAPGLAFIVARQRIAPQQTVSALRETAQLVCVSLVADVAVLALFGVLRSVWPEHTPDVGRLVRQPGEYLRESYLSVAWWTVGLLVLATLLTWLAGSGRLRRLVRLPPVAPHESASSAWWLLFQDRPGRRVHLGCVLEDGSYVSGWLASYNTSINETGDRDLTLAAPIRYRAKDAREATELADTSAVVVSARQVALLFVSYQSTAGRAPDRAAPAAPPSAPPPA